MEPDDEPFLKALLHNVKPGDGLFVYPYFACFYFLSHGTNPTRFSYLQPGLMTDADEAEALRELEAHPPKWIYYEDVPPELYLKHWPSSDPARLRLHSLERFFRKNYRPQIKQMHGMSEFALLLHAAPEQPATQ